MTIQMFVNAFIGKKEITLKEHEKSHNHRYIHLFLLPTWNVKTFS